MESTESKWIYYSRVYFLLLLLLITVSVGQKQTFNRLFMIDWRIEDPYISNIGYNHIVTLMLFMTCTNSAWLLRKMACILNFYLHIFCSHLFLTLNAVLLPVYKWLPLWFKGLLKFHLSHTAFSDHHSLKRDLLPLYSIDSLWHLFNIYDLLPGKNHFGNVHASGHAGFSQMKLSCLARKIMS